VTGLRGRQRPGVGESVKANVVLTLVENSGLLIVIFVGLYARTGLGPAETDFPRHAV